MTQTLRGTVGAAVAGAIAAGVALLFGVDRTDIVLDAYLVFVAALLALATARIVSGAFPGPSGVVPRTLTRTPRRYARPDSLRVTEDVVALGQADHFDLHFRLRPLLQDIATAGLAARTGTDLQATPERAELELSPETWSLVRPDRPRPEGKGIRGIDTASLSAVVGELERILPS
jgi:hypothetical protein